MPLYPRQDNFDDSNFPHLVRMRAQAPTRDALGGTVDADASGAGSIWQALVQPDRRAMYDPDSSDRPTSTTYYKVHLRADPGLVQEDYLDWLVDADDPSRDVTLMVVTPALDATGDDRIFRLACQRTR